VIGRKLDKYEILEEVGQGGMAVVYKGLDTSLHREVAVKVLHPHLASHDEARKRFEREARAVAKLRHENILEIFDYSGKDSNDSYIVTEFIRGRTLKDVVTEHSLGFPEIGAMITAEVCRALACAHAGGVLHRDVKPENIMIRDDGVVKLMDFGIAQILDAQRMTVTGQLLGSPAYMSPEHVEGKPLDFRTDVFAVGILLYQLTTGELPFKGKNPHEILKKIAECRYLDARVVNPLVGDRLNGIITRALARLPDDRYQDVQPLLDDVTRFIGEVELGDPRVELKQFFAKPVPYEQALRVRLIAALSKRGKAELAAKRTNVALELFNRVLTIDPANADVLAEMDRVSRRRRMGRILVGVAGAVAIAAGVTFVATRPPDPAREPLAVAPTAGVDAAPAQAPPETHASAPGVDAGAPVSIDATVALVAEIKADVAPRRIILKDLKPRDPNDKGLGGGGADDKGGGGAGAPPPPAVRRFSLIPNPKNASYSIDGAEFVEPSGGEARFEVGTGDHTVVVRHPYCEDWVHKIRAGDPESELIARCRFKPAEIVPRCDRATSIAVGDKPCSNGSAAMISFAGTRSTRTVLVEFIIAGERQAKDVSLVPGEKKVVKCDGP
jgi:serine/threonine-protein kinase